jgi:hypothetical protein
LLLQDPWPLDYVGRIIFGFGKMVVPEDLQFYDAECGVVDVLALVRSGAPNLSREGIRACLAGVVCIRLNRFFNA